MPLRGAAMAWHNDPEYAPVKKVRFASCKNNYMVMAKAAEE